MRSYPVCGRFNNTYGLTILRTENRNVRFIFQELLDDGSAIISEISAWMESHFHTDVGNAYRGWHAISGRKPFTPTKFIDMMRDTILKRLDEDNDLNKRK
jgi:hypothetical protein